MGDAVLVAVPMISITAMAVMLIIRGSRQEKISKSTGRAQWLVGSEPAHGGVMVYLYREVQGSRVGRQDFQFVSTAHRPTSDWEEDLLLARLNAEREASRLNT